MALRPLTGFITPRQFGPDQAHAAVAKLLQNLRLEVLAAFAMLFKSGRNDDGTAHPGGDALADHVRDAFGGSDDDGEVDGLGNLFDIAICLNSEHARALVAHRINSSTKRTTEQAPKNGTSHTVGTFAGTDDGDAVRRENCVQRMAFGSQDIMRFVLGGPVLPNLARFGHAHRGISVVLRRFLGL